VRTGEAWLPGRLCIASEYRLLYECVFEGVASDLCSDDRTYSIGERERESTHRARLTSRWSISRFGMNPPAVIVALLTSRLLYI
jgi:hypothetical protein